jgi:hypothetical protein
VTSELVVPPALVAELEAATTEEDDGAATALDEEAEVAPVPPVLAQAKLILITRAPEGFGAERSQVIDSY